MAYRRTANTSSGRDFPGLYRRSLPRLLRPLQRLRGVTTAADQAASVQNLAANQRATAIKARTANEMLGITRPVDSGNIPMPAPCSAAPSAIPAGSMPRGRHRAWRHRLWRAGLSRHPEGDAPPAAAGAATPSTFRSAKNGMRSSLRRIGAMDHAQAGCRRSAALCERRRHQHRPRR